MASISLTKGERLRLRPGVLDAVKIREWEFERREKGKLLLRYRPKNYTLEVEPEEIDWETYRGVKNRMDSAPGRNCPARKR